MTARSTTFASVLASALVVTTAALGAASSAGAVTPSPTPTSSSTSTPAVTATPAPSAPVVPVVPVAPPAPSAPVIAAPPTVPVVTPAPAPPPVPKVPLPLATSLSKTHGHASNSRHAVLTGMRFTNLAGVQVGGVPVTELVVLSATQARFVLPNAIDYQPKVAAVTLTAKSDPTPRKTALTFEYRVTNRLDRQMAYAFKYWNVYSNSTFGYLSGNDCANFASQTLLARGWQRSPEWFNYGPGRWSGTWVSSTALSSWLKTRPDLATKLTYSQRDTVTVGDVIQFRWPGHPKKYTSWDHTGIVSKVVVLPNGRHDIYYTSHTYNRQYGGSTGGLATYYAKQKTKGQTLKIQFFHLNK
jgi:hypothetical protein